jgi:transposase
MDKEHQRKAKQHLAVLMEQGTPWKEAAESAGLHISRSTAYRWLAGWRVQREAAFQDGRHGHPAKLRGAAWTFFEEMVKAAPETPSREVQAALSQQFGLTVSIGHLNQVRSHLGLGSRAARQEKNRSRCLPTRLAQNSTGLSPCCFSQQRSKRAWSPC